MPGKENISSNMVRMQSDTYKMNSQIEIDDAEKEKELD